MDWVADGIAIGGRRDALDHAALQGAGIRAVLQLYGPEPEPLEFGFAEESLCLFVEDGLPIASEEIRRGVDFIGRQRRMERPVLVTCGAGMSRSPAFVAAYLCEEGAGLLDAFCAVMRRHPCCMPHPEVLRSVMEYCRVGDPMEPILAALAKERARLRIP